MIVIKNAEHDIMREDKLLRCSISRPFALKTLKPHYMDIPFPLISVILTQHETISWSKATIIRLQVTNQFVLRHVSTYTL